MTYTDIFTYICVHIYVYIHVHVRIYEEIYFEELAHVLVSVGKFNIGRAVCKLRQEFMLRSQGRIT